MVRQELQGVAVHPGPPNKRNQIHLPIQVLRTQVHSLFPRLEVPIAAEQRPQLHVADRCGHFQLQVSGAFESANVARVFYLVVDTVSLLRQVVQLGSEER